MSSVDHTHKFKNRAQYSRHNCKAFWACSFVKQLDQEFVPKDSIPFENLKTGSLQSIILLSKVHLKPENHTLKMG
jgi:hypothetical protein